jgi:hypothetical protein
LMCAANFSASLLLNTITATWSLITSLHLARSQFLEWSSGYASYGLGIPAAANCLSSSSHCSSFTV